MNRVDKGISMFSSAGILRYSMIVLAIIATIACRKDTFEPARDTEKTLFVYMPWSTNLTSYFEDNILDLERAIEGRGLHNERILVFFSSSPERAELFEIACVGGKCVRSVLKEYEEVPYTSIDGLAMILGDVCSYAPAKRYAMAIGCHGMGWLPVDRGGMMSAVKKHWEFDGVPITRYFGGLSPEYQTDVETLAKAIVAANMKMEYILFDDCYMSSVEVAYALRRATDYLIASTSEMMAHGLPYDVIGRYMLGNTDYEGICRGFLDFYSSYYYPYGTLSVTDCRELDDLAAVMRGINSHYVLDESLRGELQRLDGYSPMLFHDLGRYVELLCEDEILKKEFFMQLDKTVTCCVHTPCYYSMAMGVIPITHFCGLTTSDASLNALVSGLAATEWYRNTH